MAKVKVVTDSTADIPRAMVEELDITVVPLSVHFGDDTYLDYEELDPRGFYKLLRSNENHPRSSQPSPGDFVKAYEELTKDGSEVLSIHISSELSGTYQSASMAKDMLESGGRVEVIDSRMAHMALGLPVVLAARAVKAGKSLDEASAYVKDVISKTHVYFAVDTLEYLARNGRIGKATALLGSLLSMKPILTLEDGHVTPFEKVRGDKKVMPRMAEIMGEMLESGRGAIVSIGHADCPEKAESLKAAIENAYKVEEMITTGIGAVIGTHTGPGTVALIWYQP